MKPRVWRLLLGVLLAAGLVPAQAAQFGDFQYESSGTAVTITGCTGPGGAVTIPDAIAGLPVTGIGDYAFKGRRDLTSIMIPNSVTSMGVGTFQYCHGLTSVVIPDSVTKLGTIMHRPAHFTDMVGPFRGCTGLTNVVIGNSVTRIGSEAFIGCSGLTSVMIPDSVESIGRQAFQDCTSLSSVTIPDSVSNIWQYAFSGCTDLMSVFFHGPPPSGDWNWGFEISPGANKATLYYLPGITG